MCGLASSAPHGLLVETTVDGELLVAIPSELRPVLAQALE